MTRRGIDEVLPMLMLIHNFMIIISQMIMPNTEEDLDEFIGVVFVLNHLLQLLSIMIPQNCSDSLLSRIQPNFHGNRENWEGRDVYALLVEHRNQFWFVTGETPETFEIMLNSLLPRLMRNRTGLLSPRNRLILTLVWLRQYPTYSLLSVLFNVSPELISRNIERTWIIMWHRFSLEIKWPSQTEWVQKFGNWPEMPHVVGAIDGTSHEVLVPGVNEQLFYSGHRHFHCLHTQIIIDNNKTIVYIHSGFLGHQNDATTYRQCPTTGPMRHLIFPQNARLLADSIYPCSYPLITPYKITSIRNQPMVEQRKRRKFNKTLRHRRVYVEHVIKEIKSFRCISSIFRHQRIYLPSLVELCAALSKRKVDFLNTL